ncbi:hypothetical protein QBC37DRAFT_404791 [Rhypophila decipiens]|uniref:Uncharacterized protein n=1 Tax=Rhypophila decipiens TaxID=261697 RepID=A0AAN7B3J4_9PEZI|nr:hypothetical protein QBC37DRAFT_404791 [Rhypophila decipiens]
MSTSNDPVHVSSRKVSPEDDDSETVPCYDAFVCLESNGYPNNRRPNPTDEDANRRHVWTEMAAIHNASPTGFPLPENGGDGKTLVTRTILHLPVSINPSHQPNDAPKPSHQKLPIMTPQTPAPTIGAAVSRPRKIKIILGRLSASGMENTSQSETGSGTFPNVSRRIKLIPRKSTLIDQKKATGKEAESNTSKDKAIKNSTQDDHDLDSDGPVNTTMNAPVTTSDKAKATEEATATDFASAAAGNKRKREESEESEGGSSRQAKLPRGEHQTLFLNNTGEKAIRRRSI